GGVGELSREERLMKSLGRCRVAARRARIDSFAPSKRFNVSRPRGHLRCRAATISTERMHVRAEYALSGRIAFERGRLFHVLDGGRVVAAVIGKPTEDVRDRGGKRIGLPGRFSFAFSVAHVLADREQMRVSKVRQRVGWIQLQGALE